MYLRKNYLENIKKYIGKKIIKVIVGQRRVGKTTLMKQIANIFPKEKLLYVNKEDKDFDFLYDDDTLNKFLEKNIKNGIKYVFIDEVQEIKNWEKAINSIFSKYEIEIFLTGSNSKMLSSELSTLLSGRYIEFIVYPFSYYEFIDYLKLEKGKESFKKYLDLGGLPFVYELRNKQLICEWIKNLHNTIFLKDIVQKFNIKDINLLQDLFLFLLDNIGSITNLSSIIKYLKSKNIKTNFITLSNYISYLKDVFLIYEVNLYDLKGKSIFERERKFYISDHIFRNCFFSSFNTGMGKILENIVFLEALRNNYNIFVGRIKNKEIDFVIEKGGEKKYIQVAYILTDELTIKREFGNLELINDNREKYVVSFDDINFGIINGIKHINIWDIDKVFI